MQPVGVVLLNMGGPDSITAIKPFLLNLFYDPDILPIPFARLLQKPVARMIVAKRLQSVIANYEAIGGHSPILEYTRKQGEGVVQALTQRGVSARCFLAMRYWHPNSAEAIAAIQKAGVNRVVLFTLYPQYSSATTGSSVKEFLRVARQNNLDWKISTVEAWPTHPAYITALVTRLRAALRAKPEGKTKVLFSAHSLPKALIDRGDPYLAQIKKTMAAVLSHFSPPLDADLSFQSRTGPVKWLTPSTDKKLEELAETSYQNVLVVPVSFVSDHIETLYEIDLLYGALAKKLGFKKFWRIESLNFAPDFTDSLGQIIFDHLQGGRTRFDD
ncbi:MAG: ferrochelatase [Candidatus Zixiibacteriota bacterium]